MLLERLERVALLGSAWVLYLLLGLSVVSFSMMFERWLFFRKRRDDVDAVGDRMMDKLRAGDRRGAEQILAASPSIEASVLLPAMGWLGGGPGAVSEIIDSKMGKARRDLEKGMTYLGTVGNNAPFVGLFGTVLGVVQAFHQLADGSNKAAMNNVMAGIAEALVATAVGIVVAIPAVVAYNIALKKTADIEANVGILSKMLLAYLKSQAHLSEGLAGLGEEPVPTDLPEAPSIPPPAVTPSLSRIGNATRSAVQSS